MAQERIKINGTEIRQPDEGLGYAFETTYTDDTARTQGGVLHASAMFTVEALTYTASYVTAHDMKRILGYIAKGQTFTLRYFSPYYGCWRDGRFYVGRGDLKIRRLNAEAEVFESITFTMTGVDPI